MDISGWIDIIVFLNSMVIGYLAWHHIREQYQLLEEIEEPEEEILDSTELELIQAVKSAMSSSSEPNVSELNMEDMTQKLIVLTQDIAANVQNASHIQSEKKHELISLLQGVPKFIHTVSRTYSDTQTEVESLDSQASCESSAESKPEETESDFLIRTLDALRK